MKTLILFFLLIFTTTWVLAQEVLYEDSFDTKEENWVSTDDYVEEFKNGELILHGYLGKKQYWSCGRSGLIRGRIFPLSAV